MTMWVPKWEGDRAVVIPGLLELSVYEDGDERGKWWGSVDIKPFNAWFETPARLPYNTMEGAQRAAVEELNRRVLLLMEVFKDLRTM